MVAGMADARKLTNWIWGLASAFLLFAIVAHAVAPLEPDHRQSRGSAFSASTAEVSLKSGTRALVAKASVRLEPLVPVLDVPVLLTAMTVLPTPSVPHGLSGTLPRLARAVLQRINPRAPPAA
jgi:hypothetical protein